MGFFKSLFGQNKDDQLFDDFMEALQKKNLPKAEKCITDMSDEGLLKATDKIDKLISKEPSFMIFNTLLFAAFAKRPHLKNPFIKGE